MNSPTSPPRSPELLLREVLRMGAEMIRLANEGDGSRRDPGCGLLFGRLRDAGYDLRRLASEELERHRSSSKASRGAEPRRGRPVVLVVDDDHDIVTYLSTWFEDLGFRPVVAANGFEAIERAISHRPDLITLDMSMPEKSGLSTYRDLKSDQELCQIPVIIITGLGRTREDLLRGRRSLPLPEGFVPKPIDMDLLELTVERLVRS